MLLYLSGAWEENSLSPFTSDAPVEWVCSYTGSKQWVQSRDLESGGPTQWLSSLKWPGVSKEQRQKMQPMVFLVKDGFVIYSWLSSHPTAGALKMIIDYFSHSHEDWLTARLFACALSVCFCQSGIEGGAISKTLWASLALCGLSDMVTAQQWDFFHGRWKSSRCPGRSPLPDWREGDHKTPNISISIFRFLFIWIF